VVALDHGVVEEEELEWEGEQQGQAAAATWSAVMLMRIVVEDCGLAPVPTGTRSDGVLGYLPCSTPTPLL
jgi:hypothetical protein